MKKIIASAIFLIGVMQLMAQPIYRKGPLFETLKDNHSFTTNYFFASDSTPNSIKGFINPSIQGSLILPDNGISAAGQALIGISYNSNKIRSELYFQGGIIDSELLYNTHFPRPNQLGNSSYFTTNNPGFLFEYKPSKLAVVSLGFDKNFIGQGYRSLLLGDVTSNYPFVKLSSNFWRISYSILYSHLQNGNYGDHLANKYTATHALNINIARWIDIDFFETVIWLESDSGFARGFDFHYLNPIIFYRPIEFGIGSSDNAMVGFGVNLHPSKNTTLYSQLLLDEFLLREIKAGNGWWANKFGVQGGLKSFNSFGLAGLTLLGELNLVRPFTYSHVTPSTSYSLNNAPLAHPLGANFYEVLGIAQYRHQKNRFTLKGVVNNKGYGTGLGGDVAEGYDLRQKDFGNTLGQGFAEKSLFWSVNYGRRIHSNSNLELTGEISGRSNNSDKPNTVFLTLGLRSPLFNNYLDY